MFDRVIFATDFSEYTEKITNILKTYKDLFGEVIPVRVVNINKTVKTIFSEIDEWIRKEKEIAENRLLELADRLQEAGISVDWFYIPVGDPATEIARVAEKVGASLIIMGSRGNSVLKTVLLGSVAEGVLRKSRTPVIIVRGDNPNIFDKILYVHYPLEVDERVLDHIDAMAKAGNKKIVLLNVVAPMLPPESTSNLMIREYERAKEILEELKDRFAEKNIDIKVIVKFGRPSREILRTAQEEKVTMIALRPQIKGGSLSSTTKIIVRMSNVPIFVWKR